MRKWEMVQELIVEAEDGDIETKWVEFVQNLYDTYAYEPAQIEHDLSVKQVKTLEWLFRKHCTMN